MMTEYQIGWRKYQLGDSIRCCGNAEQRRGWLAAQEDDKPVWPCRHCGRVFTDAGEWMNHDCDAQPVTVAPALRDMVSILHNAPRCQVEKETGDMLWA